MTYPHIPLDFVSHSAESMQTRADDFYAEIKRRRTVRDFSAKPVPREIIEKCILAAGCAPSGANQQPWRFVAISDAEIKKTDRKSVV